MDRALGDDRGAEGGAGVVSAVESAARYAERMTAQRLRRESGQYITKADLDKIVVLWRQPDTLALWGIPYAMRESCQQTPYDLWRVAHSHRAPMSRAGQVKRVNISDWIWLGQPGWYGAMLPKERTAVEVWLAPLTTIDLISRDELAFVDLQKTFRGQTYDQAIWGKAPSAVVAT